MRSRRKNVQLVTAMASAGITGQELAARCGIHPATVSHLINHRVDPKAATTKAIAKALNCPVGRIFQEVR